MTEAPLNLDIQPATAKDLDSVWKIIDSCSDWLVTAKGLDHWKKYYNQALVAKKIRTQKVYLARAENNPVATITLDFNPVSYYTKEDMTNFVDRKVRAGYVTALAVLPELQGRGIASRMMDFVEERAASLNGKYLRLDCRASYEDIVRFYVHRGFKTVGISIDDADNNAEYLLMERPLF